MTPVEGPYWAVTAERAVLLGGTAAILLQVAHPLVAAGVAGHSSYALDPARRLLGTMDAVLTIAFGDTDQAHAVARRVGAQHARVRGTSAEGVPYRAQDPELARWVHATLVVTGLEVARRWIGLRLDDAARERYWRETAPFGRLFGVRARDLDTDFATFHDWFLRTRDGLVVGPTARGIAADLLAVRTRPPVPAGPVQRMLVADLLPPRLAAEFGCAPTPARRRAAGVTSALTRAGLPLLPESLRCFPHRARARSRIAAGEGSGPPDGTTPTANGVAEHRRSGAGWTS
ncbi:oxygenase MpaB family protein [Kineococcus gynurae]|uniref:oxygenase MpaB family protein n=1 Tax=Kineococcus gynurae TaxID=452979 RepID=UPI0036D27111